MFDLDPGSRLPPWFASAHHGNRADVSVKLTYWTNGEAVFELRDHGGNTIEKRVSQISCWHPKTRYTRNADNTFSRPSGTNYIIVRVDDVVDVVEHEERTPVFRMSDTSRSL
jgi:hypothetical protein